MRAAAPKVNTNRSHGLVSLKVGYWKQVGLIQGGKASHCKLRKSRGHDISAQREH